MAHLPARIKTGAATGFKLLDQIKERNFEDIRAYRLYQLSLLESMDEDSDHKDIDFILSEGSEYGTSDSLRLMDNQEWKEDQLYRASEKIVEELETYKALLEVIKPETEDMPEHGEMKKPHELRDEEGETLIEERYEDSKRNFRVVYSGFSKLPEQTELDYTEPFENLDRHIAF